MSNLIGFPVHGTVGPETFEPILPPEEVSLSLMEEWCAYLTDCLKNNFSVAASISVAENGGTELWIPAEKEKPEKPTGERLIQAFAKECLDDFIRLFRRRGPQLSQA